MLVFSRELVIAVVLEEGTDEKRCGNDLRIVFSAAGDHVLPDEHSEPVAMVVPAKRLHLYVLSQGVEPHFLHSGYVVDEIDVSGRSVVAALEIALVQKTVVEIGFSVQEKPLHAVLVLSDGEGPESDVGTYPVISAGYLEIIEIRVLRRPETRVFDIDALGLSGPYLHLSAAYRHDGIALRTVVEIDGERKAFKVWKDLQVLNVGHGDLFGPDRLPDSACLGIPDSAGFGALLSAGDLLAVARVLYADIQIERGLLRLDGERKISSDVLSDLLLVYEYDGPVVDCAEMDQKPLPGEIHIREIHMAAVEHRLIRLQRAVHAAEFRFRRIRNKDGNGLGLVSV